MANVWSVWDYGYKSVMTQIPYESELATIPYTGQKSSLTTDVVQVQSTMFKPHDHNPNNNNNNKQIIKLYIPEYLVKSPISWDVKFMDSK